MEKLIDLFCKNYFLGRFDDSRYAGFDPIPASAKEWEQQQARYWQCYSRKDCRRALLFSEWKQQQFSEWASSWLFTWQWNGWVYYRTSPAFCRGFDKANAARIFVVFFYESDLYENYHKMQLMHSWWIGLLMIYQASVMTYILSLGVHFVIQEAEK